MKLVIGLANLNEKSFKVDKVKTNDFTNELVFYNYDFSYEIPAGRISLNQIVYWFMED